MLLLFLLVINENIVLSSCLNHLNQQKIKKIMKRNNFISDAQRFANKNSAVAGELLTDDDSLRWMCVNKQGMM